MRITVVQVGLGVTTVLTMTTLINSVNAALPKVGWAKITLPDVPYLHISDILYEIYRHLPLCLLLYGNCWQDWKWKK